MPTSSRDRMIRSAAALFRQQGYSGTGMREVVAHADAPRGSISHHFPGGKAQLAGEAVGWVGGLAEGALAQAPDAVSALRAFAAFWRHTLEESDFRAGCPVVAVAAEAHDDPGPGQAAGEAFAAWSAAVARQLRAAGMPRARAARLGTLVIAAIEGAIVVCRAQRSTRPLDDVVRELEPLLR